MDVGAAGPSLELRFPQQQLSEAAAPFAYLSNTVIKAPPVTMQLLAKRALQVSCTTWRRRWLAWPSLRCATGRT